MKVIKEQSKVYYKSTDILWGTCILDFKRSLKYYRNSYPKSKQYERVIFLIKVVYGDPVQTESLQIT